MVKNLKIAGVLVLICLICAAGIAGVNMLTAGTIEANKKATTENTLKTIYSNAEFTQVYKAEDATKDSAILEVYEAKDGETVNYIYTLAGKNDYGAIQIMAAIEKNANGKFVIGQVEFIENGQSFGSTVDAWLKKTFISSPATAIEGGFVTEVEAGSEKYEDLSNINTSCGATYGANTIKNLLNIALSDINGGK